MARVSTHCERGDATGTCEGIALTAGSAISSSTRSLPPPGWYRTVRFTSRRFSSHSSSNAYRPIP